jgi:peptidoglycan/LPS O-acetylase OafA/YrhL
MNDARRIAGLDGLRGIAAIAVMEFHFAIFFLPQARLFDLLPTLGRAYLAVDLFFILSGFVMAHVYGKALTSSWREQWPTFAIARFARLYPLFAVSTMVMVIVFALSNTEITSVSFSDSSLVLQPFLLQQWAVGLNWNYPSWSISTEIEAYIYFVFFAGLLLTGKRPLLIAACCIIALVALCLAQGGSLNDFSGPRALARTLAGFTLGVLLYRAHSSDDARVSPKWAALTAIVFAGLGKLTHLDVLIVGAFVCLIYYCAVATGPLTRILNSGPSVALGRWSYSIYLWHVPTHYAVMALFAAIGIPVGLLGISNSRLLILATTLIVIGLSAVHYEFFEAPVRRAISNAFLSKSSPAASCGLELPLLVSRGPDPTTACPAPKARDWGLPWRLLMAILLYARGERRNFPRQSVLMAGSIVLCKRASIDCTVRNFSAAGAGLWLPDATILPTSFDLHFDNASRHCIVVWRRLHRLGVKYKSAP